MTETDDWMRELEDIFITEWGKLVYLLTDGELKKILNIRGIKVCYTSQKINGTRKDIDFYFDIMVMSENKIVIVDVKTTLHPDDVTDFLSRLDRAKEWMPEYKNQKIIGAVACLVEQSGSMKMAIKKGLLAIKATGGSACIMNESGFEPKKW